LPRGASASDAQQVKCVPLQRHEAQCPPHASVPKWCGTATEGRDARAERRPEDRFRGCAESKNGEILGGQIASYMISGSWRESRRACRVAFSFGAACLFMYRFFSQRVAMRRNTLSGHILEGNRLGSFDPLGSALRPSVLNRVYLFGAYPVTLHSLGL